MEDSGNKSHLVTLAAGCFWGTEAIFRGARGVLETSVGYMGGHYRNPSYEDVLSDTTGHAEVAQIRYDPALLDFQSILRMFFKSHNPTILPGEKYKYRTAVFYHERYQQEEALAYIRMLKDSGRFQKQIQTQVVAADVFYLAEERHQHYYEKHPKVRGVKKRFKAD